MKTERIEFGRNARTVYTAVKRAIVDCGEFRGVRCDKRTFRISASHGMPIWGEDIKVRVETAGVNDNSPQIRIVPPEIRLRQP